MDEVQDKKDDFDDGHDPMVGATEAVLALEMYASLVKDHNDAMKLAMMVRKIADHLDVDGETKADN